MRYLALIMMLSVSACLNAAEGRARREDQVGHFDRDGLRVDVRDGHGVVRAVSATEVTLWANAPELMIALGVGAGTLQLRIENVLVDAQLVAVDGQSAVVSEERPSPTEAIWTITTQGAAELALRTPDGEDASPWRFLMFADVQEAIDRVDDVYAMMNTVAGARFVVMAGDLTERGTEDELREFRERMRALLVPIYVTLGNHELGTAANPYYDWYGRGSHMFRYRGCQFTFLDTSSATIAVRTRDRLREWLHEGRELAHVAIMHIPPIDPVGSRAGSFSSKNEAYELVGEMAQSGVDLTLYGHVHSFYAFENGGIPAFISGGGGALPERMDGVGRHFLSIDVDPLSQRFDVALVRVD